MSSNLIVIIDDSPTICKTVEVMLTRVGYEVQSFASAEKVIDWLWSAEGCAPGLFLIDLSLPKMDGYGLIRFLRDKPVFHEIPIVILSRRDGLFDHLKGGLLRVAAYIVKPFTTDHLRSIVAKYIGVPVLV